MKKIFFLSLLVFVSACAARRQAEKQVYSLDVSRQVTETVRQESAQTSVSGTAERDENSEIQICIIRYDTSQPPDPLTGRPPVKEEETRTIGKHSTEKTKSEQETRSETAVAGKQSIDSRSNRQTEEKTGTEVDIAGGRNFVRVWITLAAITGIGLLLWMVFARKKSRVFDKTFDKVFR